MRVRQLQSYLSEQGLININQMELLRGLTVGIDAPYWLRSIQMLKDPYADALGGCPPGLFGVISKELENFTKYHIRPVFVFDGMVPPLQHQMFSHTSGNAQLDNAWTQLAMGRDSEAQKLFAVATSRINNDICHFVYQFLKTKGYDCFRAPYFTGAQLAFFAKNHLVQAVLGQPGLMLFGIKKVLISLDFSKVSFEWVDYEAIVSAWSVTRGQFIDACLLAGTEFCLTYPYLNLDCFNGASPPTSTTFSFQTSVDLVMKMPLNTWMSTFPSDEMRFDHVEGYCVCKTLLFFSPVLNTNTLTIEPLSSPLEVSSISEDAFIVPPLPSDLHLVIGSRLPEKVYALICAGLLSHRIPQVIATGEWSDRQAPFVDSEEFRALLLDLSEYRQKAVALVCQPLNLLPKTFSMSAYWEHNNYNCSASNHQTPSSSPASSNTKKNCLAADEDLVAGHGRLAHLPAVSGSLSRWKFTEEELHAEMKRQATDRVTIPFCLRWHAHATETVGAESSLLNNLKKRSSTNDCSIRSPDGLTARVLFTFLDQLDMFSEIGGMTVLEDLLKDTPSALAEQTLFALELLKYGLLTGEPLQAVEGKLFPEALKYPGIDAGGMMTAVTLLSRVFSLVPMKLKSDLWSGKVDFDLAAFHSIVRILNRSLRSLVEASLSNILLTDMDVVKTLPAHVFSPNGPVPSDVLYPSSSSTTQSSLSTGPAPMLPSFMLPRTCLGIVCKYMLEYNGDPARFESTLKRKFMCCSDPMKDLKVGIQFWKEVYRCVSASSEQLGAEEIYEAMTQADTLLEKKRKLLGL